MEIPVFLFTGFLESGKTTFIQEALEGDDFNLGERTLLLMCEEGIEEYDPKRFFGKNVFIETVEEEQIKREYLEELQKKHRVERVIIEYNGMWMLDELYAELPDEWMIYQEMFFADAGTFLGYNLNMRQLVYDKIKSADMAVFNRFKTKFDKMEFHKIVRGASRKTQILYEFSKDHVELDNIPDPLPFDLNEDEIKIEDDAFAEWYRDINENPMNYEGKTLLLHGRILLGQGLKKGNFIFGRHIMTCCVEDIRFAGLLGKFDDIPHDISDGDWINIKAEVSNEYDEMYGEKGPILNASRLEPAEEAEPEVATFF